MPYQFEDVDLNSGKTVTLVSWEDLSPPEHGAKLRNKPWTDSDTRSSVGFYDSTVEYMRNDWAFEKMSPQLVGNDHGKVVLFHNAQTDTWHSTDALDIDHKTQVLEHFDNLGVQTHADAHKAYNDVSNLRMLPAVVNRARDSADLVYGTYGPNSPEWQEWVDKRLSFDAKADHPEFDEDRDLARRTAKTTGAQWAPEDGRKGLAFDAKVAGKWYEAQLAQAYAGSVHMKSPTTGNITEVPLFKCDASGQLLTRDALDIDHRIPFEILAQEMMKYADNGVATKANALDAYNETSNLRLVGRSANSSHEWELNGLGQFRDDVEIKPLPGDYSEDQMVVSGNMRDEIRSTVRQVYGGIGSMQEGSFGGQPFGMPQPQRAILLNDGRHPDHPLYCNALKCVQDEYKGLLPQQQEVLASSVALFAKQNHMPDISRVVSHEGNLYAVRDHGFSGARDVVSHPEQAMLNRTVEQNTQEIANVAAPTQQSWQQAQQQNRGLVQ
ncbi:MULTISPECIES: XVIPCD domain-containing protein [unclassified Lysobacter]|uniref:XVIPCD domain-containing protein n=1 Tax=unclassified Lysobacter TaxID=2635362 RepID=UPI0006FD6A8A|nr:MULTISPECIES: XVIPCD domain-containing protein [unclassified Lysobacter]KQZ57054.1 hypothetical protein ASD53_11275 [Lysobacter sp. Root559]KRC34905.1 hypothetical protein ASE10_09465 [Lysobacter sp. Root76]KRD70594.1 hypothetical protein ASE45_01635 [Lysobacter sp. Root96]